MEGDSKIAAEKPTRERWVLVLILLVTLLIAYVDRVNVSVLVADNAFLTDLGIKGDPVKMGLLMTSFLAVYGLANIFLSPLGDYLGPRKAMCLSIFLWSLSLMLGGIAGTFSLMLGARMLLGAGEAMHWPMQSKYVKNWFPPAERGKANSIWIFGLFIGPALAMPFFTWIIQGMGWRMSFFILALVGLIPLVLLWKLTRDNPREHSHVNREELEYIEAGLQAEQETEAKTGKLTVWAGIKTFITNYRFWLVTVFYFCNASVWWGSMAWLPSYLKVARGFSWAAMGALASLPYVLGAVAVLVFGYLSDKVGRRAPFAAISMLGAAIGIYLGAYSDSNLNAALAISLGIASLGLGLPSSWSLLQQIVPSRAIGAGAGMMNGIANGGAALAPIVIGWLIGVTGSYVGGLMYLVGMGIVGFLCMMILTLQKY
ncbi:MAG TPA: MFS transporter [Patescibacteria group bacterium]|nr:MFS transporter [Patescibacteria group bacterium]